MRLAPRTRVALLVVGCLLLAAIGIVLYIIFPHLLNSYLKESLVLKQGTEAYKLWHKVPFPVYLRFYFFNVTNTEEVYSNTGKPHVEEIGPYTFRESREKVDVAFNENGTLSYRQIKRWHFQPDLTNGSLDDVITTLNVPMIVAAAVAEKSDDVLDLAGLSFLFGYEDSKWFVRKRVRELLFDGYDDPIINATRKWSNVPFDKFGWFYKRNGSDDGLFTIFSGIDGFDRYAEVDTWNGVKTVKGYDSPCNMINGSGGDLWPPFREEGGKISVFLTDICRTISLPYFSETSFNGLEGYRYILDVKEMDNGHTNPDNKCFCVDGNCLPPGAHDISTCKFDLPAVISLPHFLYADSFYTKGVVGLKPDPEKHSSFVDVQKDTGLPMNLAANLQISVALQPMKHLPAFWKVKEKVYYPVLWFSQTAYIENKLSSKLKLLLYTAPKIGDAISLFFIGTGIILIISAFILIFVFPPKRQRDDSETLPTIKHCIDEKSSEYV